MSEIIEREPWEQRLRGVIADPRLSKAISEDLIKCFNEIDFLRKQVKVLEEKL